MNKKVIVSLGLVASVTLGGFAHRNTNLEQRLDEIISKAEQLNEDNEELRRQLEQFETGKSELHLQLSQLEANKLNLYAQLEQLELENEEFKTSITTLETENYELKKLYANMQNASSNMLALNQEDKNLIAQLIYSEARGESIEGKQAVANVVFNRMTDSRFPDTVRETIHQPRQFVESAILHTYPVTESALEAIDKALLEDVTQGAFFFWAPSIATCRWLESRIVTAIIGGHQFLK